MSFIKKLGNALTPKKGRKQPETPVAEQPRRMAEMPIEFRQPLVPRRYELSKPLADRLQYLQAAQATALKNIEANANAQIANIQNTANQAMAQVQTETRLRTAERLYDFLTEAQIPVNTPMSIDANFLIVMVKAEEETEKIDTPTL